jgi:RNA-directed DNA polymerase
MQFTESQLDAAFTWLCHRRRHFPTNADVWHLRFHWAREKVHLLKRLQNRCYQFSPLQRVQKASGEVIHLWSARDALVLKVLSIMLAEVLPISMACTHVKGHGGLKSTVRQVYDQLPSHCFVLRTDVKGYYESIDHFLLMGQLAEYIKDKFILNLLWQYLHRMVERGGLYKEIQRGISRGCPLSPLIGAFFLAGLDAQFQQDGVFYVRYMDDILILVPTRWKLRRAVKTLNESFAALKLEKHPDKTFIGQIDRGFDFLGYHFSSEGLSVSQATVNKFAARATRLYEQETGKPEGFPLLGLYVQRWVRWAKGGLEVDKKTPPERGLIFTLQPSLVFSVPSLCCSTYAYKAEAQQA